MSDDQSALERDLTAALEGFGSADDKKQAKVGLLRFFDSFLLMAKKGTESMANHVEEGCGCLVSQAAGSSCALEVASTLQSCKAVVDELRF
eukprot:10395388-Lingulodinium_polyedra.AAC.1